MSTVASAPGSAGGRLTDGRIVRLILPEGLGRPSRVGESAADRCGGRLGSDRRRGTRVRRAIPNGCDGRPGGEGAPTRHRGTGDHSPYRPAVAARSGTGRSEERDSWRSRSVARASDAAAVPGTVHSCRYARAPEDGRAAPEAVGMRPAFVADGVTGGSPHLSPIGVSGSGPQTRTWLWGPFRECAIRVRWITELLDPAPFRGVASRGCGDPEVGRGPPGHRSSGHREVPDVPRETFDRDA